MFNQIFLYQEVVGYNLRCSTASYNFIFTISLQFWGFKMDFFVIYHIGLKLAENQNLTDQFFFGIFWVSMAQTIKNNLPDPQNCKKWPLVPSKCLN